MYLPALLVSWLDGGVEYTREWATDSGGTQLNIPDWYPEIYIYTYIPLFLGWSLARFTLDEQEE